NDPDNDFHGSATGFFGPLTAHAMMMFQMHNGIASSTDGSVGPLTRGFFQRHCGNGEGMGNGQGGGMNGMGGGQGGGWNQGGMMMGTMVRGSITANNTTNIVVQSDGGNITVNISASTTIKIFNGTSTPPTAGSVTDLTVGKQVMAGGPK